MYIIDFVQAGDSPNSDMFITALSSLLSTILLSLPPFIIYTITVDDYHAIQRRITPF